MVNKDYRKEIGVVGSEKTVPKAVAIIALLIVAVALAFSIVRVLAETKKHHAKNAPSAVVAPAD